MERTTPRNVAIFLASLIAAAATGLFLANFFRAEAAVPLIVNYQGRLEDSSGNLLGGASGTNFDFKFSIWDASSTGSGTRLWPSSSPASTTHKVTSGVFDARLGDASQGSSALDLDFNTSTTLYLQVEIWNTSTAAFEALSPRQAIVSAGFSINADTVDGAHAGTSANNVLKLDPSGGINLPSGSSTFGGPVTFLGNAIVGGSLNVSGQTGLATTTFTNASGTNLTASGFLEGANLNVSGRGIIANVSSTNIDAAGYGTFPSLNFTNALGTTLQLGSTTIQESEGAFAIDLASNTNAGVIFRPSQSGSGGPTVMSVQIRPAIGNTTGISSNFFAGTVATNTVLRAWNAVYTGFIGKHGASSTFIGYDESSFSFNPQSGGGQDMFAYGARFRGPFIGNSSGNWVEVAGLKLIAAARSLQSPTVKTGAGAIIEPARVGQTDQYGIYIVEGTGSSHAPTTRYGIRIGPQELGTTKYGLYVDSDKSYFGNTVIISSSDPANGSTTLTYIPATGLSLDVDSVSSTLWASTTTRFLLPLSVSGTLAIATSSQVSATSTLTVCAKSNCTLPASATSTDTVAFFASTDGGATGASITARGTVTGGMADIGEFVRVVGDPESYEAGDLLSLSLAEPGKMERSATAYDPRLVGVVTETAGLIAGGGEDNRGPIIMALAGRLPAKVTGEGGPIAVGDLLTSSNLPGYAMRAKEGGRVIAVAMESFAGSDISHTGKIMVFINLGWYYKETSGSDLQGGQGTVIVNTQSLDPTMSYSLNELSVKKFTVGSAEEPAGFTIFDRKTRSPYCVSVEDGILKASAGSCSAWAGEENVPPSSPPPENPPSEPLSSSTTETPPRENASTTVESSSTEESILNTNE